MSEFTENGNTDHDESSMASLPVAGDESNEPSSVEVRTEDIPSSALSVRVRNKLSRHLNVKMPLGNDWQALADEFEFEFVDIMNLERERDPTGALVQQWSTKNGATFGALLEALRNIKRHDVLNIIDRDIERDADRWRLEMARQSQPNKPVQVPEVSSLNYPNQPQTPFDRGITRNDNMDDEVEVFDAFICYTESDYPFVMKLMERLENPPFSMKLCVEFRDILPGGSWADVSAELISRRCKRMIVILSPEFMDTPQCNFQTKFALALSPGAQSRRIIPIMYKQCEIPEILGHICVCNYTRVELRPWFWDRLKFTLGLP